MAVTGIKKNQNALMEQVAELTKNQKVLMEHLKVPVGEVTQSS